jgi:hypothetical protein
VVTLKTSNTGSELAAFIGTSQTILCGNHNDLKRRVIGEFRSGSKF